ncbi:MAG TPA: hypothetical protein VFJ02_18565, partial [Vicinamibacterales bacterium]|nr:hypothetical protein [Vicinamibacterales bacterium]
AIGLTAAILLARLMRTILFEVSPLDPLVLAGASALMLAVGIAAAAVPAARAARFDPLLVLRNDG